MKVLATQLQPGHRVQVPGATDYRGNDISRRYFRIYGVRRGAYIVTLTFEPSTDGPPELVHVRADRPLNVHRASLPKG